MSKQTKRAVSPRRSGVAIAAMMRPPAIMKHRLQPRGGARNFAVAHGDDFEDWGED